MTTIELKCLVTVTAFTAVLWVPYVLNRMVRWGLLDTVGYPAAPPALAPWAQRLKSAHANAVENLVVFAGLVLAAQASGLHTPITALAAQLYVGARVIHAVAYTFAMPWVRTLAFVMGFGAQMAFAWSLL